MTESRYRLLVRGLTQAQRDALVRFTATGSIGPADSRTIKALVDRELIAKSTGAFEATELELLVALYMTEEGVRKYTWLKRRRPQADPT